MGKLLIPAFLLSNAVPAVNPCPMPIRVESFPAAANRRFAMPVHRGKPFGTSPREAIAPSNDEPRHAAFTPPVDDAVVAPEPLRDAGA